MNRIGLTILFACMCTFRLSAQFRDHPVLNIPTDDLKPYNWGYFLGFNSYDFKFDTDVKIEIYDIRGILIKSTTDKNFKKGMIGKTRINMSNLSNQVYIVRLTTNRGIVTKNIVSSKIRN